MDDPQDWMYHNKGTKYYSTESVTQRTLKNNVIAKGPTLMSQLIIIAVIKCKHLMSFLSEL